MKVTRMHPHRLGAGLLGALLVALVTRPLPAQDLFTPNFPEMDIRQVIEIIQGATGRPIIIDSRVQGQSVTFLNSEPMTEDELWQVFHKILQNAQYFVIEGPPGIWSVVPEIELRPEASPIAAGTGAEVVTRTIEVENMAAAQLMPMLRPMIPQEAHIGAIPGTNMLIFVDRADNLDRVFRVIEELDRTNVKAVERVQLRYAAAEDVAQNVTAVVQAESAAGLVGLQAIPDERTNSVLLTGTPSQIERYRGVVESLDLESTQSGGAQVRYLEYADAETLAGTLGDLFGSAAIVEDAETAVDLTGGTVNVIPDIDTNSLVLAAPSRILQEMLSVIDALDIPRAQVNVQAIIVEMSESRAAELGLTFAADGSGDGQAALLTNFSIAGGILQLAQIGAGGTPDAAGIGAGITAAVGDLNDSGTSWAAVVRALQGDGHTNVLSMPELTVLDNAEASINVGQSVPLRSGEYAQTGAGGGVAGINPFNTINYQNVGTGLVLTPRINEGTGMRLTITQNTSSVSESSVGGNPILNEREIITEVFVDDGDILVLGGLKDDQLRQNEERVPGLGRIPGLRWLFRSRNTDRLNQVLMVFIKPTILRDSVDASRLSADKYRYLQEEQRRRAEEPVPLMRDVERPTLPPLPGEETEPLPDAQSEALPSFDAPPSIDELRQRAQAAAEAG